MVHLKGQCHSHIGVTIHWSAVKMDLGEIIKRKLSCSVRSALPPSLSWSFLFCADMRCCDSKILSFGFFFYGGVKFVNM